MKLFKLTLVVVTFLISGEAAHAVGKMDASERRDGQLICASGYPLKVPAKQSDHRDRQEQPNAPVNASDAR